MLEPILCNKAGHQKSPVSAAQAIPSLTSGCLLASNTVWNLLGQLLPMGVAVVAIPPPDPIPGGATIRCVVAGVVSGAQPGRAFIPTERKTEYAQVQDPTGQGRNVIL